MSKKNKYTTKQADSKGKKLFLSWLDNYAFYVSYHSNERTTFLDVFGYDGGDVTNNGLEDFQFVRFDEPASVDKWYEECVMNDFKDAKKPSVSFVEFCKNNG